MSDEPIPGWVEVTFTDADGHVWSVFDKPPVFANMDDLTRDSPFPVAVELDCEILSVDRRPDQTLVTISTITPWGVSADDGRSTFTVLAEQLRYGDQPG
ncbi:hypothetical protein ACFVWG_26290 [Kribbella sp. NPDC058245]|uniref:hypothetical protein n=1 Tax=Kribbella sp. NPDC058245 TaxID=3346399 RepID=UPI0036EB108D